MTQETCHLGILQFPWVVYLEKVESPLAVRMHSQVGAINPLHCTGLGKALLPYSSAELINAICSLPLEPRTAKTITSAEDLQEESVRIRDRGYAISIAGPADMVTLKSVEDLGPIVASAALDVSHLLSFHSKSGNMMHNAQEVISGQY